MSMDADTVFQRLKRYGQVSTKLPGLFMRLASGQYMDVDRVRLAQDLRAALGDLKGPLMKVAQMLSTIPDALPMEYASELAQLQSNAPSMGWPFVKRRMQSELGADWQSRFKDFEKQACSAASLGQVHKATHLNGEALACKLQYPQMASVVEADLAQLRFIFKFYEKYDSAIQTSKILDEISDRLLEELDYEREAKHIALYAYMLKNQPQAHVPQAYSELSTSRLLTMSWQEGVPLRQIMDRSQECRNQIARQMFRAWYEPFYSYGVIHGDPHLGNYTFREDNSVNLMDFGCLRIFPAKFVGGVIHLYKALLTNDMDMAVEAYKSWGFENPSKELIEVLNGWARFLYGPVMDNRVRHIDETRKGIYGREVAAKVHEELRKIGGVTPPAEFVFMDRAAIGLGSVFLHLKAELNWYEEFQMLIQDFSPEKMQSQQQKAMIAAGLEY
ncbi:MAG: AarF/ABC1/UbiB kinase family protein [Alphaproteobacteria bacterium]|nr:AarF/ABC1/UbiB kinase family protein [Alphaproteobacteria bacterium]